MIPDGLGARNPLGVCTWLFGHHDHLRIADRVAALGLSGVELFSDIDHDSPRHMKQVYGDQGLRFFSLTPDNVDIAHADGAQRLSGVRYYERLIDFAGALGCPRVTCHEAVGRPEPHDSAEQEWARLVDSCVELARFDHDRGVQVAFEPLHRGLVSRIHGSSDLRRLLAAVDHPALGGVLDTFHMDLDGSDPVPGIRALGRQVMLVQLADRGRKALGTGGAPLQASLEALDAIGCRGPLILECSPQLGGPSLAKQSIDPGRLQSALETSRAFVLRVLGTT